MIVKFGAGAQCADFFHPSNCNASSEGAIFGRLAPRVEQAPPKWLPTPCKRADRIKGRGGAEEVNAVF